MDPAQRLDGYKRFKEIEQFTRNQLAHINTTHAAMLISILQLFCHPSLQTRTNMYHQILSTVNIFEIAAH